MAQKMCSKSSVARIDPALERAGGSLTAPAASTTADAVEPWGALRGHMPSLRAAANAACPLAGAPARTSALTAADPGPADLDRQRLALPADDGLGRLTGRVVDEVPYGLARRTEGAGIGLLVVDRG